MPQLIHEAVETLNLFEKCGAGNNGITYQMVAQLSDGTNARILVPRRSGATTSIAAVAATLALNGTYERQTIVVNTLFQASLMIEYIVGVMKKAKLFDRVVGKTSVSITISNKAELNAISTIYLYAAEEMEELCSLQSEVIYLDAPDTFPEQVLRELVKAATSNPKITLVAVGCPLPEAKYRYVGLYLKRCSSRLPPLGLETNWNQTTEEIRALYSN